MKDARLRGLYEYTNLLKVPAKPGIHVPYRLLAQLASTAPEGSLVEYVSKRLTNYGMIKEAPGPDLVKRMGWAAAWAKREGAASLLQEQELPELSEKQRKSIEEFAAALAKVHTADDVQTAAFGAMRASGLQAGEFFPAVYGILLGAQKGPRLGPYVLDAGIANVANRLQEATSASGKHN